MGRQEIRAREADGSSASATPSTRLLSLRPLHNIVELATVLVPEPGQRTNEGERVPSPRGGHTPVRPGIERSTCRNGRQFVSPGTVQSCHRVKQAEIFVFVIS